MSTLKGGRVINQIQKYRQKRQMSIEDMARLLNYASNKSYWEWEVGRRMPTLENALRLSYALRCPVEVLFFDLYDLLRREVKEREERLFKNRPRTRPLF